MRARARTSLYGEQAEARHARHTSVATMSLVQARPHHHVPRHTSHASDIYINAAISGEEAWRALSSGARASCGRARPQAARGGGGGGGVARDQKPNIDPIPPEA